MAHDKSPERSNLILFYAVLSVATLVALAFVFQSYFSATLEQQRDDKVELRPNTEADRIRAEQRKELNTGPMPIDRAKAELAKRGRTASAAIAPEPSDDLGALEGWTYAKGRPTMGGVPVSVAEPGDGGAPEQAGPPGPDGGVAVAADGGVAEGSDSEGLQPAPGDTRPEDPAAGPGGPAGQE